MLGADHPLWTDYVAAFGSIVAVVVAGVGVLIAIIALYYAIQSTHEAEESSRLARRTADAAGELVNAGRATLDSAIGQLRIARLEHERLEAERARRPAVEAIVVSQIEPEPGEDASAGTFRVGFTNTGDKALSEGIFTIMVERGALPEATNRWGDVSGDNRDDVTTERWPGIGGTPRAFDYLASNVNTPRGVSLVRYVRVRRYGRFAVRAKLFSADLEGDGPWVDVLLDVSEAGVTKVDDLSTDAPPSPTAGRSVELTVE